MFSIALKLYIGYNFVKLGYSKKIKNYTKLKDDTDLLAPMPFV
jgi:hypothetical protein